MATTTGGGAPKSPSASPRLPSPPPIAEDQTGPQSPQAPSRESDSFFGHSQSQKSDSRRIRPGTKSADMNEGPPLVELSEKIDSAFQLTEHLKALHFSLTHPPQSATTKPIDRSSARLLSSIPAGIDRSLWLYELCRFLVQKLNMFLTGLFIDTPPCSAGTCPEMRASEWQYLCAVHDPPKSCCAIDYCCHTLDWAANTLASPKFFPSRLSMGGDPMSTGSAGTQKQHQERHLTNIFRRVYRIFAHAWFQHREVFWRVEGRTGLYVLFKTVCDSYQLIPEDNYTIPPEAEGLDAEADANSKRGGHATPSGILRRSADGSENKVAAEGAAVTARRHKHALSRGGSIVAPVIEEAEEEEGGVSKSRDSFPEPPPPPPSSSVGARKTVEQGKPSEAGSEEVSPAMAAANVAAAAAGRSGGRSSHYNMSPVSPHAMSAADLVTASGGPGPAEESPSSSSSNEAVTKSEDAAKTALSNAEGQQAGTTEAADADAAAKTVQD